MRCHVELIGVKKYNCIEDYKTDDETIYNVRGKIPYVNIMTRVMMYV